MKNIIRLEELAMFLLAVYFNSLLPYSGWLFWALLLAPDLSMMGYLINPKIGAYAYNFFHHKGVAILFYIIGLYIKSIELQFTGILLFGHSSMDRVFGYGLKYLDSFHNTHLGLIGKSK
jgi:Domain of unknown function (DUF4260)